MRIIPGIILLLAVLLPNMVFAGHGAISETDTQIIVEYEGDTNEVIAANLTKAKEEISQEQEGKLKVQEDIYKAKEVERIRTLSENHARQAEKRRAKYNDGYED